MEGIGIDISRAGWTTMALGILPASLPIQWPPNLFLIKQGHTLRSGSNFRKFHHQMTRVWYFTTELSVHSCTFVNTKLIKYLDDTQIISNFLIFKYTRNDKLHNFYTFYYNLQLANNSSNIMVCHSKHTIQQVQFSIRVCPCLY